MSDEPPPPDSGAVSSATAGQVGIVMIYLVPSQCNHAFVSDGKKSDGKINTEVTDLPFQFRNEL